MNATDTEIKTCTVRHPFAGSRGTTTAYADSEGTVRVWDDVAGHYTVCHSLTPTQIARVRRLTMPR